MGIPFQEVEQPIKREGLEEGDNYLFCNQSCLNMPQITDEEISLTITSPPYWNAIDYDIHTKNSEEWHRKRQYNSLGETYEEYIETVGEVFKEVHRVTAKGGFCAIVIGTILYKGKHYPAPMSITESLRKIGWIFHQDIIWNKVTGGVRRAGSFIQRPFAGYYYPNIMTEYVLIFRKEGEMRRDTKQSIQIDELFTKDIANNIWHIAPVPPKKINHPCPYPEELVRRLLLLYSHENDIVLDPFLGSGQTALVSLQNNRKCIGYDVEKEYIKLSLERVTSTFPKRKYNLVPEYKKIKNVL